MADVFTPRLLDGTRLRLPVTSLGERRGLGYRGRVSEPATGQYYDVFGATCPLPDCACDAIAVPVDGRAAAIAPEPTDATRRDQHRDGA
jgi:hypothetical protein